MIEFLELLANQPVLIILAAILLFGPSEQPVERLVRLFKAWRHGK